MDAQRKEIIKDVYSLCNKVPLDAIGPVLKDSISYRELLALALPNNLYFKQGFEKYFRTCEDFKQFMHFIKYELLLSNEEVNEKSFFKNWSDIKDKSEEELIIHKLIHYITTYGLGSENIKDNYIYIPESIFSVLDLKMQYIDHCSLIELTDVVNQFIYSNVAYSREVIESLIRIITYFDIKVDFNSIKNREIKVKYSIKTKTVPSDADEFLKIIVAILTDSTLYVKNDETIATIKDATESNIAIVESLFNEYTYDYGLAKLAEIFYRNKKIFLAIRHISPKIKKIINRVRRLATKHHKPYVIPKYLQITNSDMSYREFRDAIMDLDLAHLIKLRNAIEVRNLMIANDFNNLKINIRNGKTFIRTNASINKTPSFNYIALQRLIRNKIEANLLKQGIKYIKVDKNIDVAIPTSEKQILGAYSVGTIVNLNNENITFGIYWKNIEESRCIDLDLSCKLLPSNQYINYTTDMKTVTPTGAMILHSGDIICAPKGANEAINISRVDELVSVEVHLYAQFKSEYFDVDFYLTQSKPDKSDDLRIVDLNNVQIKMKYQYQIKNNSQKIGYIIPNKDNNDQCKFIVSNDSLSSSNSLVVNEILNPDDFVKLVDLYSESYLRISNIDWRDIKVIDSCVVDSEEPIDSNEILDLTSSNISKEIILKLITEE